MTILSLLLSASIVSASFSGNLNYRSPSLNHPDLGISIRKVVRRNDPADLNFTHGVASGDPYPDSVILWTRVAPANADNSDSNVTVSGTAPLYDHDNAGYVAVSTAPICVVYKVAEDMRMETVVDKGTVWTSSDVDYTVKVCMWRTV
jgi:alkaline phosphatase D